MLPLEQCRKILGERAAHLNDGQIIALRDSLYRAVNLIFDHIEKRILKNEVNENELSKIPNK